MLEPVRAHDLESDPLEASPLQGTDWARELIERHEGLLRLSVTPLHEAMSLELTDAELADLAAMGYTGED